MQLFFAETISDEFKITGDEARHIIKVLRKSPGDLIQVTNGKGEGVGAEIIELNKNDLLLKRTKILSDNYELKTKVHLLVAPTKSSDRFEWMIEKATELGVVKITPVQCDRSERKSVNVERCQKVAMAAMKQSGRFILPEIAEMARLKNVVKCNGLNLFAHCEDQDKTTIESIQFTNEATILIGPEGDFSPDEIQSLVQKGFTPVALGNSRLRTETAAIYAMSVVRAGITS